MSIKTIIEPEYIVHIPDSTETLEKILTYITDNFDLWKDKNTLWDVREFNFNNLNHEIMESFTEKIIPVTKSREGLKTAFVVKDDLAFGMTRMLQMLYTEKLHMDVNIFKNMDDAIDWLLKKN